MPMTGHFQSSAGRFAIFRDVFAIPAQSPFPLFCRSAFRFYQKLSGGSLPGMKFWPRDRRCGADPGRFGQSQALTMTPESAGAGEPPHAVSDGALAC